MRTKTLIITCMALLFGAAGTLHAATVLKKLGTHPFDRPPLTSVNDLKRVVQEKSKDIRTGFTKAGAADLYTPFMEQVPGARIEKIQIYPQEKLQWMLFRKNNRVRVIKDVLWAGQKPFDAFRFYVDKGSRRYEMVVPLICANFSLRSIGSVPPAPKPVAAPAPAAPAPAPKPAPVQAAPAPPPNQAPVCRLTVTPQKAWSGQTVTVDASGSSDADGNVASVTVAMIDANGKTVAEKTISQAPFSGEMVLPAGGKYKIKATVTDDDDETSTGPECEVEVASLSRGHFLMDMGPFYLFDPALYAMVRLGYEYKFNPTYSIIGLVGAYPVLRGEDDDFAVSVDATFNYRKDRWFVGTGVGVFESDMDSRTDLIVNTGVRLFGDPDGNNVSFFVEGRSDFGDLDRFDKYGRLGGGIRIQF